MVTSCEIPTSFRLGELRGSHTVNIIKLAVRNQGAHILFLHRGLQLLASLADVILLTMLLLVIRI